MATAARWSDAQMWAFERELSIAATRVAGVDEVGRGCLAGPVLAAAVVLGPQRADFAGLVDSKLLTRRRRERLAAIVRLHAADIGLGWASPSEIDAWNILVASRVAMARALDALRCPIDVALIDGPYPPQFERNVYDCVTVVDGDARCPSIAAASIVAKVERDGWMRLAAVRFPGYGFERNAGYGTAQHRAALERHGPTALHRQSFAPVRSAHLKEEQAWS